MTRYEVTVTMAQSTVVELHESGYALLVLKAVRAAGGGKPLVWQRTTGYSLQTLVSWSEGYQAYTSRSEIVPGGRIVVGAAYGIQPGQFLAVDSPAGTGVRYQAYSSQGQIVPGGRIQASASYPAELGQKLTITSPAGTGQVTNEGVEGTIMITSKVPEREFACGISQLRDGKFAPICALPLDYNLVDLFTPVEKVLPMFSTAEKDLGTVIVQAFSDGIFVTLTGAEPNREVNYAKGKGWTCGGASWCQTVDAGSDIIRLLIQPSRKLELARVDAIPELALAAGEAQD